MTGFQDLESTDSKYLEEVQEGFLTSHWLVKGKTYNTCNHESNLSQVYTYTWLWSKEDTSQDYYDVKYWLISVHQGCDIRGGYTKDYICIPEQDSPMETVWGSITYINNDWVEVTHNVSNEYDWTNLGISNEDGSYDWEFPEIYRNSQIIDIDLTSCQW
jgi:hypothetical protein